MKKIETMTPAQELLVPVYLKKWLENGRRTKQMEPEKCIDAVKTIYRCAKMKEPKHFFFFPSPIQCQLAVNIMKSKAFKDLFKEEEKNKKIPCLGSSLGSNLESNLQSNLRSSLRSSLRSNLESNLESNLQSNLWSNLWSNLRSSLGSNLGSNLRSSLGSNLGSNLESNLQSNLRSSLRSSLRSNLRSNLWSNLQSNLRSSLRSSLRSNLESNLWSNLESNLWSNLESNFKLEYENIFWGNQWTYWVGFYDFILNELFEDQIKKHTDFVEYLEAVQNVHLFIPFDDVVFISDFPIELHLNERGLLHADQKPAMSYWDGYSLFYLNGIWMPKEIIEPSPEKLKTSDVMKLPNVEQRLMGIKKIGPEKMLKELKAKSISKKAKEYELFEVTLEGSKEKLLKMKNPSEPKTHYEWVEPHIKTVNEALAWRRGISIFKEPVAKT